MYTHTSHSQLVLGDAAKDPFYSISDYPSVSAWQGQGNVRQLVVQKKKHTLERPC